MLYFAYGSNLHIGQMKERCPSAEYICTAKLPDYKLDFRYKSTKRKCGVADVIKSLGKEVWGVVYQISELDIGRLDKCEGFWPNKTKKGYTRIETRVLVNGVKEKPHTVWIYVLQQKSETIIRPSSEYKNFIVTGAQHWGLPDWYIEKLKAILTTEEEAP